MPAIGRQDAIGGRYAYYVVGVLMLAYMLSFIDRIIVSLLIAPIKAEFALSDTQVGLMLGFGFALFYAVLGLPFGMLADRANRRKVMTLGILGWSLATAATALAGSYAWLLGTRAMVGIGEASLGPSAASTIADRFPRERLGLAMGIFASGVAIGSGLAMGFGGLLATWAQTASLHLPGLPAITGWRLAFLVVGLIGLPVALLMQATVREARRRMIHVAVPATGDVLRLLRRRRGAFGGLFLGLAAAVMSAYLPLLWSPALLARIHGLTPLRIGVVLGISMGGCGIAGNLLGGLISDRLARRGVADAPTRVILLSQMIQLPVFLGAYLTRDSAVCVVLLATGILLVAIMGGLQSAAVALVTPPAMRGRMTALYGIVATLVGTGFGPLFVGLLSDHAFPGPLGLSPALATVCAGSLLTSIAILQVGRPALVRGIVEEAADEAARGHPA